jgi:hypothetical protein
MNFSMVLKSLISQVFALLFLCNLLSAKDPVRLNLIEFKISAAQFKSLGNLEIKIATGFFDSTARAIVTPAELELLTERGFTFTRLMQSCAESELYKRAVYGESMMLDSVYHTYPEILTELQGQIKKYPNLIRMQKIGLTSQEKRDIWAVKLSDNVHQEEDEPAILFSGAIHSDELAGVEICLTLISHLLENYATDANVRRWVDRNEIWFIPVINVDGHFVVTHNIDPRWRKNARDNNQNGILYEPDDGIDLNRNFDFNWAHGGAGDSLSSRYRGEFPFSESECCAVRDLAYAQKFLLAVTYHSQGEVIFYPWDWRGRKAPDDKLLTQMAKGLAGSIRTLKGDSTYHAAYGAGMVGQTYPWFYGVVGTLDFVVETGSGWHIFPKDTLENVVQNNLPGAFFMLDQMEAPGLTGWVQDASGKPLEAEIWLPDIDTKDIQIRTSNAEFGRFFRLLEPGKYRLIIRKDGYHPVILKNVTVSQAGWTELKITLKKK